MKLIYYKIQSNGMQIVRLVGKINGWDIRWFINSFPNSNDMKNWLKEVNEKYIVEEIIYSNKFNKR